MICTVIAKNAFKRRYLLHGTYLATFVYNSHHIKCRSPVSELLKSAKRSRLLLVVITKILYSKSDLSDLLMVILEACYVFFHLSCKSNLARIKG